ncbi:MAG: nucleoid-associated protein [Atopobiaceae bacterium]|nr:nucleoid-associated protein [Atopobiaceae bacterium]
MLKVHNAILHVFDFETGGKYLSDRELDLSERPTRSYVQRHLRKVSTSPESRHGEFCEGSAFAEKIQDYFAGREEFVALSQDIGLYFWEELRKSDDPGQFDVLVADFEDTDATVSKAKASNTVVGAAIAQAIEEDAYDAPPARRFAVILLPRRQAFVHDLRSVDGQSANDVVRTDAALPNPTQKVDSYLVVDADTLSIDFNDCARSIAGRDSYIIPDGLLQCTTQASSKEVISSVTKIVEDVAEEYGMEPALAVSEAKAYVAERAEMGEVVLPQEVGEKVFEDAPQMRETYERKAREERLPEEVPVRRGAANRMTKNHHIRTDTGIEITFPSEYARRPDYIEFQREADGSMRITLKGIARIENR